MTDINGIHYEISKPVKNQKDGYFYQRVRQVDDKGNVVGFGDQMIRSARPESQDGLFDQNASVTAGSSYCVCHGSHDANPGWYRRAQTCIGRRWRKKNGGSTLNRAPEF